jgi:predicted DNA-binding transcriptional regulator AlpA
MRTPPFPNVYTYADLAAAGVNLSRSRLSRLQMAGEFPRPYSRPGEAYWLKSEIDRWVANRRAGARDVTPAVEEATP